MKTMTKSVFTLALVSTGLLTTTSPASAGCIEQTVEAPRVEVVTDKRSYIVGEIARLTVRITNASTETMTIRGGKPSIADGRVRIFIAKDEGEFLEYRGPGWGQLDAIASDSTLVPRAHVTTEAAVLYNQRIPTGHLKSDVHRGNRGLVASPLAFPEAGTYQIEARLFGCDWTTQLRSSAVAITVTEPTGADAEAWAILAQNPDNFFFVHTGHPRGSLSASARQAQAVVLERITHDYPSSVYAPQILARLDRYLRVHPEMR